MRQKAWLIAIIALSRSAFLGTSLDFGIGDGRLVRPTGLWRPSLLLPDRGVKVWLPRCYDETQNANVRYDTLYVHDGQNAMEDATSWTG